MSSRRCSSGKEAVEWPVAKNFAHLVCAQMAQDSPEPYLDNMSKSQRVRTDIPGLSAQRPHGDGRGVLSPRARAARPCPCRSFGAKSKRGWNRGLYRAQRAGTAGQEQTLGGLCGRRALAGRCHQADHAGCSDRSCMTSAHRSCLSYREQRRSQAGHDRGQRDDPRLRTHDLGAGVQGLFRAWRMAPVPGCCHPFMAPWRLTWPSAASRRCAISSLHGKAAAGGRIRQRSCHATVRAAVATAARLRRRCPVSRAASPSAAA